VTMPLENQDMETALSETQYLLKRWRFAASAAGFFWVQPNGAKLCPEELAGFITLLRRGCENDAPRAILFDFSEVDVIGGQWTLVESMLNDFAQSVGFRCRLISATGRPLSAVLLYRRDGDLSLLATKRSA
jgi:hypothetical protein